jgi:hypothetical protein
VLGTVDQTGGPRTDNRSASPRFACADWSKLYCERSINLRLQPTREKLGDMRQAILAARLNAIAGTCPAVRNEVGTILGASGMDARLSR